MIADVCVLIEGTYPYAPGGVSTWTHSLIGNLPQFNFSVVYIGSTPEQRGKLCYELPKNVVDFREVYIHDTHVTRGRRSPRHNPELWSALADFHLAGAKDIPGGYGAFGRLLCEYVPSEISSSDLLFARQSWDIITHLNAMRAADIPFTDYFWTYRFTHLPILNLLNVDIPKARVYHAVSAGYNALLGAFAKIRYGSPLLLTEHGIYTREREIEISQLDWIRSPQHSGYIISAKPGYFQQWWIEMFRHMTRFSYEISDRVISITGANQRFQLQNGADPGKMMVIPNGIDIDRMSGVRRERPSTSDCFTVGFVGRVVGIKDVKTFIRAIRIASTVIPNLLVLIVGPEGEEPDYAAQCHQLVETLGLSSVIQFTGSQDVRDYYARMDVLVLTSLSEGQPLVILEANCAGVPAIASDVGACRELLLGDAADDRALGPSGLITPPAHPRATADALIRLWRDEGLREQMSTAGFERVRRYYRQETLYAAYDDLYAQYAHAMPEEAGR